MSRCENVPPLSLNLETIAIALVASVHILRRKIEAVSAYRILDGLKFAPFEIEFMQDLPQYEIKYAFYWLRIHVTIGTFGPVG